MTPDQDEAASMLADDDLQLAEKLRAAYKNITAEIGKVIVGQQQVVEQLMIAMFAGGHSLLVGVPGLAKTLMIRSVADALSLKFSRIQFTPDLMPSDVTGTEVIQENKATGERQFRFIPGPIFGNVILADEVNRTPPKTQSALLEAMQEHQVTVSGQRHLLPDPFFVLATQNPIEQEGTYPLPEAQLDRFMFEILIDYPDHQDELEIIRRTTIDQVVNIQPQMAAEEIMQLSRLVRRVPVADHIAEYALRLVRHSRPGTKEAPDFINEFVRWGAGPRASQYLILAAKAHALLHGNFCVEQNDIRAVVYPVLRHRIRTNFSADAENIRADEIIRRLIDSVPQSNEQHRGKHPQVFKPANTR
jgi:MoxR-like ATPase